MVPGEGMEAARSRRPFVPEREHAGRAPGRDRLAHDDMTTEPIIDRFGRVATDLRVSVTDRCNLRCTYCMPPEGVQWLPRAEILDYEEIARLVGVFHSM